MHLKELGVKAVQIRYIASILSCLWVVVFPTYIVRCYWVYLEPALLMNYAQNDWQEEKYFQDKTFAFVF